MNRFGKYLKECRERLDMTLRDVSEKTGITDSRLSKIENDRLDCPANELRKLAKTYNIPVVSLFLEIGYLIPEDLSEYQQIFQGINELDNREKNYIQEGINLIRRGRKSKT